MSDELPGMHHDLLFVTVKKQPVRGGRGQIGSYWDFGWILDGPKANFDRQAVHTRIDVMLDDLGAPK